MPDINKYISPAPNVASLNLIFDGKVLDIKLDSSDEAGYKTVGDIVREGDPAEGIHDSHSA